MADILRFRLPVTRLEEAKKRLADKGFIVTSNAGTGVYKKVSFRYEYLPSIEVLEIEILENGTMWPNFSVKRGIKDALKKEGIKEC
jgi:hypothetical protein